MSVVIVEIIRWFAGETLVSTILRARLFSLLLGIQLLDEGLFTIAVLFAVEPVVYGREKRGTP